MMDPDPDPENTIVLVSVLLICLCVYGFLTAAHTAVLALSEAKTRKAAEEGDRKAARLLAFMEEETRFTLRVNTAKAVCALAFCGIALGGGYPVWTAWFAPLPSALAVCAAVLLVTVVSVFLLFVLAEIAPRRIASWRAERLAPRCVGGLRLFCGIAAPLAAAADVCSRPLVRLFGLDPHTETDTVTEEEILQMVDEGEESGVIEETQKEMIENIFAFDDIAAEEIMTPRTDVVALTTDSSVQDALRVATEEGYSRIPLYEDDIDHIRGVLYVKDLLPFVGQSVPDGFTLRQLMRDTYFVPGTKRCGELFTEMTEQRVQMAVVVDEYGGVAGIVTLEDLLESIVGNIQDEFDNEEEELTQTGENLFNADGGMAIDELCERWDVAVPDGDFDTVAGFMIDALGRIPEADEHPSVRYENLILTVERMDDRRIERIHIEVCPKEADA